MKTTPPRAVALLLVAIVANASAFTLDFAAVSTGASVSDRAGPMVLAVPGYGLVSFSRGPSSNLDFASMIGSGGRARVIDREGGESLVVNFQGATPIDVDFASDGADVADSLSIMQVVSNQYLVGFTGVDAGVAAVHYEVVPEPAGTVLAGLGSLLLLRRRRS